MEESVEKDSFSSIALMGNMAKWHYLVVKYLLVHVNCIEYCIIVYINHSLNLGS